MIHCMATSIPFLFFILRSSLASWDGCGVSQKIADISSSAAASRLASGVALDDVATVKWRCGDICISVFAEAGVEGKSSTSKTRCGAARSLLVGRVRTMRFWGGRLVPFAQGKHSIWPRPGWLNLRGFTDFLSYFLVIRFFYFDSTVTAHTPYIVFRGMNTFWFS